MISVEHEVEVRRLVRDVALAHPAPGSSPRLFASASEYARILPLFEQLAVDRLRVAALLHSRCPHLSAEQLLAAAADVLYMPT